MKFLASLSIFFLFIEYSKFHGGTYAILTGDYVQDIKHANYMVSIRIKRGNDDYLCGGVIYDCDKFVTAAHCLYNITSATVSLASLDPLDDTFSFDLEKDAFVIHQDWHPGLYDHDIAVGFTPMKMIFCDDINKIEVVERNFTVKENLSVAAYGYGTSNNDVIDNLRQTVAHVMKFAICSGIYSSGSVSVFRENMHFCLKLAQNGENHVSKGDSGGPIVSTETGELVGIIATSAVGKPDVCIKIASYKQFLADPDRFARRHG